MGELQILEGLVVFLIILPLLRPFFVKLESLDGLFLLPPLSFGITIAIFPAYGFRPEGVPLLAYTFFLALKYVPSTFAVLRRFPPEVIREKKPVFVILAMVLLIPVAGTALFFAPSREAGLASDGVYTRTIQNPAEKTEFALRIYGPGGDPAPNSAPRPLMLVVPPITGSVAVTDQVCLELRDRGFTALSYSRPRFDSPYYGERGKKQGSSLAALYRIFRVHTRGLTSLPVNADARALEAERIKDITFLLSYIQGDRRGDSAFSGVAASHIFIAGYGTGGGAVIQAAASPAFTRTNPGVKGIIAIESPVFSAFTGEGDSRVRRPKISLGAIPRPEVPALYLVSDKALDPRHRDGRYAAVFGALQGSREPAVLAVIPGAGPLDYSDIPEKFPFYRVLFPGKSRSLWKTRNFTRETAALMTNFAALFWGASPDNPPAPRRENLAKDIHLETGGAWNFRNPWDILGL